MHCKCKKAFYCSTECQQQDSSFHEEKCEGLECIEDWEESCQQKPQARLGLTGIRNLNNSCYLSSCLQCLSHTVGLTKYFLNGHFRREINYQNTLGTQGKLAIGYAKLIK